MSYGVKVGQEYIRADGTNDEVLTVVDADTFAYCDDVVVRNQLGETRRIDAFKLAMARYSLKEES